MIQRGHQGHAANDVTHQSRSQKPAHKLKPRERTCQDEIEHLYGSGNDVRQTGETDQISNDDDNADPRSFGRRKQPHHQRDQPDREYAA